MGHSPAAVHQQLEHIQEAFVLFICSCGGGGDVDDELCAGGAVGMRAEALGVSPQEAPHGPCVALDRSVVELSLHDGESTCCFKLGTNWHPTLPAC